VRPSRAGFASSVPLGVALVADATPDGAAEELAVVSFDDALSFATQSLHSFTSPKAQAETMPSVPTIEPQRIESIAFESNHFSARSR
jgi:hypothetical protein